MRQLQAESFGIDGLAIGRGEIPSRRFGEILIRVKAVSLNYRDLVVLSGSYMPDLQLPYVPASDACGIVEAVGEGVRGFSPGDRVIPCYIQGWRDGRLTAEQRYRNTLGGPLPGVLREFVAVPADDAVHAPPELSDAQGSTLPIAAATAWNTLMRGEIRAGSRVLVQGTGGVAVFALQFARAMGAQVIALTSTEPKAQRLRKLGAEVVINYREQPQWAAAVREATGGHGADIVVETTGSSLQQSIAASAFGGFIGLVGFVGGYETTLNVRQLIGPMVRIEGIVVGSKRTLLELIEAMRVNRIEPLIDSVFPFERAADAFRHLESGSHLGKIVIEL
ncbi:MAG: zinc-dependent alcohol dehydrogenase family protein [Quisquiliibacterium sp.]